MRSTQLPIAARAALAFALVATLATLPADGQWPTWRGPNQDAVAASADLPDSWSKDGENLIWRQDFTGRSTPVVHAGRVCANGRVGEGITRQEMVACFDAESGEKLWEHRFNVYHTTVPWNRVGWANPTIDPETGYLYVQGVGGLFFCFDSADGRIVWWRNLVEDFGFMEGYGGRTQTPTIDEDRVILSFANNSWGSEAVPRHRYRALDKRTGEQIWVAAPATSMADKNTQSTPAVAVIGGERLVIAGNGDGWIYAMQSRTGKVKWSFHLSQRGINTSVLVDGDTVYVSHSEENLDQPTMGRVVAIDATGEGDITATGERWRADIGAGYASPLKRGDVLYVVDNSANLHALDAATGEHLWEQTLGTVGKGSPAYADGKLFVTEVNGKFQIVRPGENGAEVLDSEQLDMPDGSRYAETYGSPAIAGNRIYFTTEEGIYCVGDPDKPAAAAAPVERQLPAEAEPPERPRAPQLLVVPGDIELRPGDSIDLKVFAFNELGQPLREITADWALDGLKGKIANGKLTVAPDAPYQTGSVVAARGSLEGEARVRVTADLPMHDDFSGYQVGGRPAYLKSAASRFEVQELDGEKVLAKPPSPAKLHRHHTLIGHADMAGYTIQADVYATRTRRRIPDVGLVNSGYVLDMMGVSQQLQLRSWAAELRMAVEVPFSWETERWYTMKLRVERQGEGALVQGKVWPKGETEPAEWSIVQEDPLGIHQGSPGLLAYTPAVAYYDNIEVTPNQTTGSIATGRSDR